MYGICPECNASFWGWCPPCNSKHFQNDFDKWTSGNNAIDKLIQDAQLNTFDVLDVIEWIPYDRFKDIKEIAKGGFGIIYKATWIDGPIWRWNVKNLQWNRDGQDDVALKKFNNNFANLNEGFINEIEIHLKTRSKFASIRIYGITQDPETNEYIMALEYMKDGNLRDHLKNNFNNIDWKLKLGYLKELTSKFKNIHKLDIIHHDFHPGNILSYDFKYSLSFDFLSSNLTGYSLYISDFGLSKLIGQNIKNPEKRQIFGVLPYIAPEVLSGEEYTKAADVYSFGIVAYEIITGFAPYHDIPHDIDLARQICNGLRPKIPFHIPKLITRLIMRCWDAQVTHRPTFEELNDKFYYYFRDYSRNKCKNNNEITIQIKHAEKFAKNNKNKEKVGFGNLIRNILTNSTIPTPINYKTHPEAIYTSRLLDYSSLPKPKNDKNFEKEIDELTKSISTLSIVTIPILWELTLGQRHYTVGEVKKKALCIRTYISCMDTQARTLLIQNGFDLSSSPSQATFDYPSFTNKFVINDLVNFIFEYSSKINPQQIVGSDQNSNDKNESRILFRGKRGDNFIFLQTHEKLV
ncbi:hypothetical protein Glove_301g20 [Diversispora epigaea]|uniref:Protein kinase domain-containing protein n=1 Tax=Diversispora epigaea TaxID=1348612 RepID=A0A397HX93_9GLOM|nr:hypothetical protein Glove_301g20 [Diversispora epigaea]